MRIPFVASECCNNRTCPFVCKLSPFICHGTTSSMPIVCFYRPSVVYTEKNNGFTLIEILVTVAVVGVLVALAAPAFTSFIANQRISNNANELLTDLNLARSEAIKRAARVSVCKTANPNLAAPICNGTDADRWTTGRLIFTDTDGDGVIDAGDQILRIRQEIE